MPIFPADLQEPPKALRDLSGCQACLLRRQTCLSSQKGQFYPSVGWQVGWPADPPPPFPFSIYLSGQSDPLWKSTKVNRIQNSTHQLMLLNCECKQSCAHNQVENITISHTKNLGSADSSSFEPLYDYYFQKCHSFWAQWHPLSRKFKMSLKKCFCSQWQVRKQKSLRKLGTNFAGGFTAGQQFLFCRFCFYKEQGQQSSLSARFTQLKYTRRAAEFLEKTSYLQAAWLSDQAVETSFKIWAPSGAARRAREIFKI